MTTSSPPNHFLSAHTQHSRTMGCLHCDTMVQWCCQTDPTFPGSTTKRSERLHCDIDAAGLPKAIAVSGRTVIQIEPLTLSLAATRTTQSQQPEFQRRQSVPVSGSVRTIMHPHTGGPTRSHLQFLLLSSIISCHSVSTLASLPKNEQCL